MKNLEAAVRSERAYCVKHHEYITVMDLYEHKCYTGNHGKSYCKYLRVD